MSKDEIARADRAHVWHPFTDMAEWCADGPDDEQRWLV